MPPKKKAKAKQKRSYQFSTDIVSPGLQKKGREDQVKQEEKAAIEVSRPFALVTEHGQYTNIVGSYHSEFSLKDTFYSQEDALIEASQFIHKQQQNRASDDFQIVADFPKCLPDNGVLVRIANQEGETYAVHIRKSCSTDAKQQIESKALESDSSTRQTETSESEDDKDDFQPMDLSFGSSGNEKQLYILSKEKGQWDPLSGIEHTKFEVVAVYDSLSDAVQNSATFMSNKSWEDYPHNFEQIRDSRRAPPAVGSLIKTIDLENNIEAVSITTRYLNDEKKVFTARSRNHPSMKKLNGYVLSTESVRFDEETKTFQQESERRAFFHTKHEAIQCAQEYMSTDDWYKKPYMFQQIEDYRKNAPENGVLIRTVDSEGEICAVHIYYQVGDPTQTKLRTNKQKNSNVQPAIHNKRKNTPCKYLLVSEEGNYNAWTSTYYPQYEIIGIFQSKTDAVTCAAEFMSSSLWLEEPEIFQDVEDNRECPPENGNLIKATDQEGGVQAVYIRQYDESNDESTNIIKLQFPEIEVPTYIPRFTVAYELLTYSGYQDYFGRDYQDELQTQRIYQSKENLIRDSKKYIKEEIWNAPRSSLKEFVDNRKNEPSKGILIKVVSQDGYMEAVHIELQPIPDSI